MNKSTFEDDAASPAHASLIQQRMAIERQRLFGIWIVCVGALLTVGYAGLAIASPDSRNFLTVAAIAVWLVLTALGVSRLSRSRRSRLEFENAHGRDAGRQEPNRST